MRSTSLDEFGWDLLGRLTWKPSSTCLPCPAKKKQNTGRSVALPLWSNGGENKTGHNFKKLLQCALSLLWERYHHPARDYWGLISTATFLQAHLPQKMGQTKKVTIIIAIELHVRQIHTSKTFPPKKVKFKCTKIQTPPYRRPLWCLSKLIKI